MAGQNLEKEYADIKAGVDGSIGDVPSPSDGEGNVEDLETTGVEAQPPLPQTNYGTSEEPTPSYNYNDAADYSAPSQAIDSTRIHQIVEAIVSEKFDDLVGGIGDLSAWKEKINHDVVSIKQELIRTQERFDNLQNAVLGKIKDYDSGLSGINTEMKALEKVFERIMEPLVTNVKELSKITEEMKRNKR